MIKLKLMIRMKHNNEVMEKLRSIDGLEIDLLSETEFGDEEVGGIFIAPERARDVDVLFCVMPFANMEAFENLKLIQVSSAGYAQLQGLGLPEKGIRVCNGRGIFDTPIGEWSLAMMTNLNRDLRGMIRNQDAGVWDRAARFQQELRGMTVGFFGYGSIARETARLARAYGMEVHAFNRTRVDYTEKNYYVVPGSGDHKAEIPSKFFYPGEEIEFCKGLDFLVAAMPLMPQTKGIIKEEYLRALPKGAFVINFARGPIIDEGALLSVLRDGHLGGAALDVHYLYPMPADHPLWRFPNVIMTPHISGAALSSNYLPRAYDILIQNIRRVMDEQPLLNELTAEQLGEV